VHHSGVKINISGTESHQFAPAQAGESGEDHPMKSLMAREYGIPAVVATGDATVRLHSGQRVTVDGSAGTVTPHTDTIANSDPTLER
jgi:phosphoenolpyruvate-protein kinase (PTS system EI component)